MRVSVAFFFGTAEGEAVVFLARKTVLAKRSKFFGSLWAFDVVVFLYMLFNMFVVHKAIMLQVPDQIPADEDAARNDETTDNQPPPAIAKTERCKSCDRYGGEQHDEEYEAYKLKAEEAWRRFREDGPKWIEALCAIALVVITLFYTKAAYRQLKSMNNTFKEIQKQTKSAQQSAYAACLAAQISRSNLIEFQRSEVETHGYYHCRYLSSNCGHSDRTGPTFFWTGMGEPPGFVKESASL